MINFRATAKTFLKSIRTFSGIVDGSDESGCRRSESDGEVPGKLGDAGMMRIECLPVLLGFVFQ